MRHRYDKRRKPADQIKSWRINDVAQMQDIHHQIKRRIFLGGDNKEIAKVLGVSTVMVSMVRNSVPVRAELKMMHKSADSDAMSLAEQIDEISQSAVDNLKEIVEDHTLGGEKVSLNLIAGESNKILDRSMGKPAQTIVSKSTNMFLTADDIQKLKDRAIALGIDKGIIDVTPKRIEEIKELEAT